MSKRTKRNSLISIFITFAISSLSASIIFPILAPLFLSHKESIIIRDIPTYVRPILLGIFLSVFPMAQFIFSPLIGEFADRRGRKITFLITILMECIGYLFGAAGILWKHLSLLFIGRIISGIAAGNVSTCLVSLVDLSQNEKTKTKYFSYGSAVAGIMFMIGPFIGGRLSDRSISNFFTLDLPMWVGGILAFINFLIVALIFKESLKESEMSKFDVIKAIHNVQLAFKTPDAKDLYIIYFFFLFALNMVYQFLPAIMVEKFDFTSVDIGDVSAVMGVVWIVGTIGITAIMHTSVRIKYVIFLFFLLFSVFSIFIPIPQKLTYFLIFVSIVVFISGAIWPIFTSAISNAAGHNMQGNVLGLSQSIQSLSMMLAPLIGGFLLQEHSNILFIVSSASAIVCCILLTKVNDKLLKF